jgi:hypothetical protein
MDVSKITGGELLRLKNIQLLLNPAIKKKFLKKP